MGCEGRLGLIGASITHLTRHGVSNLGLYEIGCVLGWQQRFDVDVYSVSIDGNVSRTDLVEE